MTFAKSTDTESTRFKFRVPFGDHGDTYDRFMIRLLEMREARHSTAGVEQFPRTDHRPKAKIRGFRPPVGEAYGRIEAPKGELGFYLISDGGPIRIVTGFVRRA